MRKPFYVQKTGAWYVWLKGKQERLTARGGTEEEAFAKFAELQQRPSAIRPSTEIVWLLDEFVDWVKVNQSSATFDWYRNFLTSFCKFPGSNRLTVSEIRPFHVVRWADKQYGKKSPSTRHGAIRAVQRAFAWASKLGVISLNPLASVEKPTPNRREQIISASKWAEILTREEKLWWRDFFTFMRETGCRVHEARTVEATQFDEKHNRFIIPAGKAKGKKIPRVIYCNQIALEIVKRRISQFPSGSLFRNKLGRPITRNAIRCRMRRYGKGICATLFRHTFITEALTGGTDCVSVAALCGHDPATLAKVYQKLSQNPAYLSSLANTVRPSDGEA